MHVNKFFTNKIHTLIRVSRYRHIRKLAHATKALHVSKEPFAPYKTINRLQRAFSTKLPYIPFLSLVVPYNLNEAAASRIRNLFMWEGNSHNVQEAIICWNDSNYKAKVLLPPYLWNEWNGNNREIRKTRSMILFLQYLRYRFKAGIIRFKDLIILARKGISAEINPYCVVMNVDDTVVESARWGGFLQWIKNSKLLPAQTKKIWISSHLLKDRNVTTVDWLDIKDEPFPSLSSNILILKYFIDSIIIILFSVFAVTFGRWQIIVLLSDLLEQRYFKLLDDSQLPCMYIYLLGDMPNRPLWTWYAEERGCTTPLVFYASSYSLFSYNNSSVGLSVIDPSLLENNWNNCWFQTQSAVDLVSYYSDRSFHAKVVGAFDMVDGNIDLTRIPKRALAVFDVEPTAQLLRQSAHGYICPQLAEKFVCIFWEKLAEIAIKLNFVLIHKPKRPAMHFKEYRYTNLLKKLEKEGIYIAVPTNTSIYKLMQTVVASVILPFTSVGDIAMDMDMNAIYFDPLGGIENSESHSSGCKVAKGQSQLHGWLATYA